ARVVDPEDGPRAGIAFPSEISDLRIVAVDDEGRVGGQLLDGRSPTAGNELELAVSVELVAEEVAETDRTGPQPPSGLGQRGLVDLEQPELCVARGEQRRRNARDEVCSGAVVSKSELPSQNARGHCCRRRLPIRRRDERGAKTKPPAELIDGPRIKLPEQLARDGRAASGAGKARELTGSPGQQNLQP